jgi:hypothetical protein
MILWVFKVKQVKWLSNRQHQGEEKGSGGLNHGHNNNIYNNGNILYIVNIITKFDIICY